MKLNKEHLGCRICRSELKDEVEKELKKGRRIRDITFEFVNFFEIDLHLLEQSIGNHFRNHYTEPHELTDKEKDFLKRVANGTATKEEQVRVIATKAMEKALLYPQTVKITDLLKLEQFRLRKQKAEERVHWELRQAKGCSPYTNTEINEFYQNYQKMWAYLAFLKGLTKIKAKITGTIK